MKTLALVPAKAHSTGIPGKNTRLFVGKPLLAWAIEVGRATCDATFVTTDDVNIGLLATQYGAGIIMRGDSLARHGTPMLPVIQHALGELSDIGYGCDMIVLLQPTQPLRTAAHIRLALEMLTAEWDSVVSVVEIPAHYSPDYAMQIRDRHLEPFILGADVVRRQDARLAYSRDGTVYAVRREMVMAGSLYGASCRALVIPHSESCNLDSEEDWKRAEEMMQHGLR